MKYFLPLAIAAVGAAVAGSAVADVPAKPGAGAMTAKPAKSVTPTKMSCEEFLSYDEVTRPQIVFLSEGLQSKGKGKAKDPIVDIDRINTLVPVVIEDCKTEPKASFWQKLKARL